MSNELNDWLNKTLNLNININNIEKIFSNGYYFGLILYLYNFNPNFFDNFNNKYQRIYITNNYNNLIQLLKNININLTNKMIKSLIKEEHGVSKTLLFEIKQKLYKYEDNIKIKNKTNMEYNEFLLHQYLKTKDLQQKNIKIEKKLIKYYDKYLKLKIDSINNNVKELNIIHQNIKENRNNLLKNRKIKKEFIDNWDKEHLEKWKESINYISNIINRDKIFINNMTDILKNKQIELSNKDKNDYIASINNFEQILKKFGINNENKTGEYYEVMLDDNILNKKLENIKKQSLEKERLFKIKIKNERKNKLLKVEHDKQAELELKNSEKLEKYALISNNNDNNYIEYCKNNIVNQLYNDNINEYLNNQKSKRNNGDNIIISNNFYNNKEKIKTLKQQIFDKKVDKYERKYYLIKSLLDKLVDVADHFFIISKTNNKKQINKQEFNIVLNNIYNDKNNEYNKNLKYTIHSKSELSKYYNPNNVIFKSYLSCNNKFKPFKTYNVILKQNIDSNVYNKDLEDLLYKIVSKTNNKYLNYNNINAIFKYIYECPKIIYYGNYINNFLELFDNVNYVLVNEETIDNYFNNYYNEFMTQYNLALKKLKKNDEPEQITDKIILLFNNFETLNISELSDDEAFKFIEIYINSLSKNILFNEEYDKENIKNIIIFDNYPKSKILLKKINTKFSNYHKNNFKKTTEQHNYITICSKLLNNDDLKIFNNYKIGYFDNIIINDNIEDSNYLNNIKIYFNKFGIGNYIFGKLIINEIKNIDNNTKNNLLLDIATIWKQKIIYFKNLIDNPPKDGDPISKIKQTITSVFNNLNNSIRLNASMRIGKEQSTKSIKTVDIPTTKREVKNELYYLSKTNDKCLKSIESELLSIKNTYLEHKNKVYNNIEIIKSVLDSRDEVNNLFEKFIIDYNIILHNNSDIKTIKQELIYNTIKDLKNKILKNILSKKEKSMNIKYEFNQKGICNILFDKIYQSFMFICYSEINKIYYLIKILNVNYDNNIPVFNIDFINNKNTTESNYYDNDYINFPKIEMFKIIVDKYINDISDKYNNNIRLIEIEIYYIKNRISSLFNYIINKYRKFLILYNISSIIIDDNIVYYLKELNSIYNTIEDKILISFKSLRNINYNDITEILNNEINKDINSNIIPKVRLIKNDNIIKIYFIIFDITCYFGDFRNTINNNEFKNYLTSRIDEAKIYTDNFYKKINKKNINELLKLFETNYDFFNVQYFLLFNLLLNYEILKDETIITNISNIKKSILWLDIFDEKKYKNINETSIYYTYYIKKLITIIINNDINLFKNFLLLFKNSKELYYKDLIK